MSLDFWPSIEDSLRCKSSFWLERGEQNRYFNTISQQFETDLVANLYSLIGTLKYELLIRVMFGFRGGDWGRFKNCMFSYEWNCITFYKLANVLPICKGVMFKIKIDSSIISLNHWKWKTDYYAPFSWAARMWWWYSWRVQGAAILSHRCSVWPLCLIIVGKQQII